MGCDIHCVVEYNWDGEMFEFCSPNISRNYDLFGLMAGVRGPDEPFIDPRGIPKDACSTVRRECIVPLEAARTDIEKCLIGQSVKIFKGDTAYNPWLHDFSWFTPSELQAVMRDYNKKYTYRQTEMTVVEAMMWKLHEMYSQVRLVFWFDN